MRSPTCSWSWPRSRLFGLGVFLLAALIGPIQCQQGSEFASSTGFIKDIMDIFAPAPSPSEDRKPARTPSDTNLLANLLPPFGINRKPSAINDADDEGNAFSRVSSSSASLVSSVSDLLANANSRQPTETEERNPLRPVGDERRRSDSGGAWSSIAKDVMGLFAPQQQQQVVITTTTAAPVMTGLEMFNPKFMQKLIPDWMQPLNPFHDTAAPANPSNMPPSSLTGQSLLGSWSNVLDARNPATQVDTGRGSFDRLLIRENADPEDPIGSLLGGRWKERGVQWTDGNLRLVNKKGNKLLGSEVAVHDRSIDIPVQRWFDIANNLVEAYGNPDTSLFPPK